MALLIVPKVRWEKYVLLLFAKIKKNSYRGKVFAGTFLASGRKKIYFYLTSVIAISSYSP